MRHFTDKPKDMLPALNSFILYSPSSSSSSSSSSSVNEEDEYEQQTRHDLMGAKSRVETQIKITIQLQNQQRERVTQWSFIRINTSMLVNSKIRKIEQQQEKKKLKELTILSDESKILNLEAYVIRSDANLPIRMCEGCVRRERKRAERIKMKVNQEEDIEKERDRILLFNCNSFVNFASGEVTLPTRITCYCRHHNEKKGFRICFVMKNHENQVIATTVSPPIMITDDHKNNNNNNNNNGYHSKLTMAGKKRTRDYVEKKEPSPEPILFQPSNEEHGWEPSVNEDYMWDLFADSLPTPALSEEDSWSPRRQKISHEPLSILSLLGDSFPQLERVVPAQGPTYGGTEVTLLGTGFYHGLTCLFGDKEATVTCVNENTMICLLPPAAHPGPVVVSFKEHPLVLEGQDIVIFTYYDASDQALLELALQVIGLKTTGKLQPATQIAMSIVNGSFDQQAIMETIKTANLQYDTLSQSNSNGHTLLHLAVLVKNEALVGTLLDLISDPQDKQQFLNAQDSNGMTALHFACLLNCLDIVRLLLRAGSNPGVQSNAGLPSVYTQQPDIKDLLELYTRRKPLSRRGSVKSHLTHRFHSLSHVDIKNEDIQISPDKEMDGLGFVHQKLDHRLYVFWLPVLIVVIGFICIHSIGQPGLFKSFILNSIPM
ncbi:hypothetical protein G6F70_007867 [Rhizopus microsporus]|nr:hypothetical protein G6F71_007882 [Rhizopus microsporus]KAG1195913.1 hypothetical protein G6F70_007867 [Rhizopus microsporus]KAG1207802.1 hypothetical protein G6F69_007746 [Rhizopus microsporus]KAG1228631.1 hypothetical protein G6F67_007697 [Rhizopus microsporus]KAG1262590.1 hypothetical protein G6F68_005819 [Rhizopus microsporus]